MKGYKVFREFDKGFEKKIFPVVIEGISFSFKKANIPKKGWGCFTFFEDLYDAIIFHYKFPGTTIREIEAQKIEMEGGVLPLYNPYSSGPVITEEDLPEGTSFCSKFFIGRLIEKAEIKKTLKERSDRTKLKKGFIIEGDYDVIERFLTSNQVEWPLYPEERIFEIIEREEANVPLIENLKKVLELRKNLDYAINTSLYFLRNFPSLREGDEYEVCVLRGTELIERISESINIPFQIGVTVRNDRINVKVISYGERTDKV